MSSYFAYSINSLNQLELSSYPFYVSGLNYDSYNNNTGSNTYFTAANSLSFFATATKTSSGTTTSINYTNADFNALSSSLQQSNSIPINFAFSFYGYFIPKSNGVWTFTFSSDDTTSFWLGTAYQTIDSLKNTATLSSVNSSLQLITTTPIASFTVDTITISSGTGATAYTNGTYTASASSILNTQFAAYNAFRGSTNNQSCWISNGDSNYLYSTSTGAYLATSTSSTNALNTATGTTSTIRGEWLQIKFPYSLVISSYTIYPRENIGASEFAPSSWYILGSNDNINWVILHTITGYTFPNYTSLQTFNVTGQTIAYLYFRMVITNTTLKSVSYGANAGINQWNITGMYGSNLYSIPLTSGSPYPMLLNYGQGLNNAACQMGITPPSGNLTYDGTPYFFREG